MIDPDTPENVRRKTYRKVVKWECVCLHFFVLHGLVLV